MTLTFQRKPNDPFLAVSQFEDFKNRFRIHFSSVGWLNVCLGRQPQSSHGGAREVTRMTGFWTYMCVLTVVVGIVAIAWIFRDWRG